MRHTEPADPIIQEVRLLRRQDKALALALIITFLISILTPVGYAWVRDNDLKHLTNEANREQVATCFRNANQRADQLDILIHADTQSPGIFIDILRANITNLPTIPDCRQLADDLNVGVPR